MPVAVLQLLEVLAHLDHRETLALPDNRVVQVSPGHLGKAAKLDVASPDHQDHWDHKALLVSRETTAHLPVRHRPVHKGHQDLLGSRDRRGATESQAHLAMRVIQAAMLTTALVRNAQELPSMRVAASR